MVRFNDSEITLSNALCDIEDGHALIVTKGLFLDGLNLPQN